MVYIWWEGEKSISERQGFQIDMKPPIAQKSFCVWHSSLKELKCTSTEAARRQSRIGSDNLRDSWYYRLDIATRKLVLRGRRQNPLAVLKLSIPSATIKCLLHDA